MSATCGSTRWWSRFAAKKGPRFVSSSSRPTAADPAQRKTIELVRDEIKLKDQEARADIIIKKDRDGDPVKLGWITLPSFYADMDGAQQEHDQATCSRS